MKKNKIFFGIFLLLGMLISPLFCACNTNVTIVLNTPESVEYQINEDTGRELLVAPVNKYASAYVFGISVSNYDGLNTNDFLKYEVPATYTKEVNGTNVEISHNFLDVTNIFKNAKTYYFYVQYKGSEKYKDSAISKVNSVSITQKLETPYLSLTGGTLSWSSISHADRYSVYSQINGKATLVETVQDTTYDVSLFIEQKVSEGIDSEIEFFVFANTTNNYIRSADSNVVTYFAHLYLNSPTNLSITKSGENRYLIWQSVKNAKTFTLKVNNLEEALIDVNKLTTQGSYTSCDVTSFYEKYGLGEYQFSLKANGNGKFVESSYSAIINDTYTKKLEMPKNVRLIDYNGQVLIAWQAVENAHSYILVFSDPTSGYALREFIPNDSNGIPSEITTNSILLSYAQLGITSFNDLKSQNYVVKVAAKGYQYYTTSNYSNEKAIVIQSQLLASPQIVNIDEINTLQWDSINGAVKYGVQIEYDGLLNVVETRDNYFDYTNYLSSAGEYLFACYAIGKNVSQNSLLSNVVKKVVTKSLETPTINSVSIEDTFFVIDFSADSNAKTNSLFVNGNLVNKNFTKDNSLIQISSVKNLANNSVLNFQILSNPTGYWTESEKSNEFSLSIRLQTPTINSISIEDTNFVIDFSADSKAETNSLLVNGNLVNENFTKENSTIQIASVKDLASNNILNFQIRSNPTGYWTESEKSNVFDVNIKLGTPSISLSSNRLSWKQVDNALSYCLVLDDKRIDLESTQTFVDLTNFIDVNNARQVTLIAVNENLIDSDFSTKIIYNRPAKTIDGYTNKYFYYGKTYDYYITNEEELYDLIEYSFFNFLPTVKGYIDYDLSTSITSKITNALNKISATKALAPVVTKNANGKTGEFAVSMNYYTMIDTPFANSQRYAEYEGSMVSFGNGTRDSNHIFQSDNYIVTQEVYSTDGLLSAIEHHATPIFIESNSLAEEIYNKAKSILIEIIDDTMTDFQKALAIHDYIAVNVSYDTYGLNHVSISNNLGYFHYIESALNYGLGVCDAYAKSFSLLCNMEGIDCMVVDGLSDSSNTDTGHAWNKIYLDHDGDGTRDWFAVDCTWDDIFSGDVEYLMHTYFLVPDTYFESRQEDGSKIYPGTTTESDGFYSVYTYGGAPILIDSLTKVNQLKSYMMANPTAKIEYLVAQTYKNSMYKYYEVGFKYSPNENYVVAYTN